MFKFFKNFMGAEDASAYIEPHIILEESNYGFEIAGESHHQRELGEIVRRYNYIPGEASADVHAIFAREPNNSYDSNAIKVTIDGLTVGHFPRDYAEYFVKWMTWRRINTKATFLVPAIFRPGWSSENSISIAGIKLKMLRSPPKVKGDLDTMTKKAINIVLKQNDTLCATHMNRPKGSPAQASYDAVALLGLIGKGRCVCGKNGFYANEATFLAKFGCKQSEVNDATLPVGGWDNNFHSD